MFDLRFVPEFEKLKLKYSVFLKKFDLRFLPDSLIRRAKNQPRLKPMGCADPGKSRNSKILKILFRF
jgi:hypothetical protein